MFVQRLKEIRAKKDISQSSLADFVGLSQQAIAKWETGKATPDPEMLVKLADFFGVTIDYLLAREDKPDPAQTIADAIADDMELADFWAHLRKREDLQLLFKQTKDLPASTIKRIVKYIKMVEDEEANEE